MVLDVIKGLETRIAELEDDAKGWENRCRTAEDNEIKLTLRLARARLLAEAQRVIIRKQAP